MTAAPFWSEKSGPSNGSNPKRPCRAARVTRPVNADTAKIAQWLGKLSKGVERTTAQIVALTGDGEEVWHWNLTGVIPVKWTGPSFSADSAKVATETLELAHHGFLSE